jgi:hypothetical protein
MYLSVVDRKRFRDEAQNVYEGILPDPAARLLTWTWPRWIPLDDTARGLERAGRDAKAPPISAPPISPPTTPAAI